MKVFKHISELPKDLKIGLTIGNFDGVHIGHQELLKDVLKKCQSKGREMVVMTFVPHPLTILKNENSFLLNSYEERRTLLQKCGVKWLIELEFTRDFSTRGPDLFLKEDVLAHQNISMLFLGHDFAFGANKKGDHNFVQKFCENLEIQIIVEDVAKKGNCAYSSTAAREALLKGDTQSCKEILGRDFFLKGRVIKGAGRGKQIGFPTANISVERSRIIPSMGVYATMCRVREGLYQSITNVGKNPTFNEHESINIETNIFDFSEDIYGEEIEVIFKKKIRDEVKFNSVNDLISQIKKDVEKRKDYLD